MEQENPLGIRAIDHLHFYVHNIEAASARYLRSFGFSRIARARDLCLGVPGSVMCRSDVINQNRITFVFTEPRDQKSEIWRQVAKHGDGVHDIAFLVEDAAWALEEASRRGAAVVVPLQEKFGEIFRWGSIAAYGDVVHTFVERKTSRFAPSYKCYQPITPVFGDKSENSLLMIDHVVANVYSMAKLVEFYKKVFGFRQTQYFDISTPRSALTSIVLEDSEGYIKLPINEPFNPVGAGRSQIQEFLDDYNGPGVQHVALLTHDIISTVRGMQRHGVEFLWVPPMYYDALPGRVGLIEEDLAVLKETKILADRESSDGYLLQIFTRRHPFFEEIIQRKGNSCGFGHGNFQALFEAIEREQILRGTI